MQRNVQKQLGPELTWESHGPSDDLTWSVRGAQGDTLGIVAYRKVAACLFGGCSPNPMHEDQRVSSTRENMYYFAILHPVDGHIEHLGILEYESNYGFEITSKGWLRQFFGLQPEQARLGGNIDGISGATVSVQALIHDVNQL